MTDEPEMLTARVLTAAPSTFTTKSVGAGTELGFSAVL